MLFRRSSSVLLSVALLTLPGISGCGYSLSATANPHIKTIAVPIFENETLEKGVEEILTDAVADALQENRQLTLTDERRADSIIHGTIINYRRKPYSYDSAENVQEYKVEIICRVEYEDRKKRKVLWEEGRMLGWSTYFIEPADPELPADEDAAQRLAAEKLAEDIKTKTVEGW